MRLLPIAVLFVILVYSTAPAEGNDESPPPLRFAIKFEGEIPEDLQERLNATGGIEHLRITRQAFVAVNASDENFKSQFAKYSDVVYVTKEAQIPIAYHASNPLSPLPPTDQYWGNQWGPNSISAPAAWAYEQGSQDVKVAVLDTGIQGSHQDLNKACRAHCLLSVDVSTKGHGTAVAGVIAAHANGPRVVDLVRGMVGLANISLMSYQVADDSGAYPSDVAAAIEQATDDGADVINQA